MGVLDLFSAAAGGWSLGMHRAGFRTVAACEAVAWRRALYAQNNPGVPIYDDVCTLTADRILADLGYLPDVVVGSPPCQDISPANTKGKGVEGERSGLYFEAVRIIGECHPRWFALENSANLRTRGADAVLAALEALGYACWAFVVRAGDIGANHERPRSWIIGCDLGQIADAAGERSQGFVGSAWRGRPHQEPEHPLADVAYADSEGQSDGTVDAEMGRGPSLGGDVTELWADWNGGLASHLRVDDGLSAWVAGTRVAVGGPRGTSAASLIVEAFGDAVVPQIPDAIGRAILRTQAALAAIYSSEAA